VKKYLCYSSPQYSKEASSSLKHNFPGVIFEIRDPALLYRQHILTLIRSFRSYEKTVFFTYDSQVTGKPPVWIAIINWLSKKGAYIADTKGRLTRVGWGTLVFSILPALFLRLMDLPFVFIGINRQIKWQTKIINKRKLVKKSYNQMKLAYIRSDLIFGTKAGGSVGHISGVIHGFLEQGSSVFVISTDNLELIDTSKAHISIVRPETKYNFLAEVPQLHFNKTLFSRASRIFQLEKPNLIYQRYSLDNYTGVALAREFDLPFILEYNGSEVWVARNWGRRLRHENLGKRIEILNFRAADVITVVSKPLKDEIVTHGIPERKILVNPNGVDPQRYRPDIDGDKVRRQLGLEGKTTVGFIGTFGNWHGAEVLAQAAVKLVNELKAPAETHFLFIGDGVKLPLAKQIIQEGNIEKRTTFTGMVPQEQGPEYLAACDILVAPHVPNPDGSPFFGSPTKLFEYMAMGKGIVASNLDQIGEVLEHEKTAFMVEPGNAGQLAQGILTLVNDKDLRLRLGANARREVLEKYTWKQHVAKTMEKLAEVLGK
jgi:glycosyltransferase involved in cell wall biosynthesis